MLTDEQIMIKVVQGDIGLVSELFCRYSGKIYNYYLSTTYDPFLSQDLTQITFEKLIKYKSSYKENNKFKTWLYTVASNVKKDHFRKEISLRKRNATYFESMDKHTDPLLKSDQKETMSILHQAINNLPEDQREVIWMSKFEKMKYIDIAHVMNVSESAIKVKVHRAIKRLRIEYLQLEKQ